MIATIAAFVGIVAGAFLGYVFRRREWLRDQRLSIYSEFMGAFLGLVETSMALVSLFLSFGDEMLTKPEWREASMPALTDRESRRNDFDLAMARVKLISDSSSFEAAERIERFVVDHLSRLPPYHDRSKGNPLAGIGTLREDAHTLLKVFLWPASRHAGVRPRGAKAAGLQRTTDMEV